MKSLKVFNFIVVLVFSGLLLHGQQVVTRASTKIELIKRRIKKSKNDTAKIKLLQQWSDLVFITDPQKDLELQEEVINICTRSKAKRFFFMVVSSNSNSYCRNDVCYMAWRKNY